MQSDADPARRRLLGAVGTLAGAALCVGAARHARAAAPLRVVASFSILADIARAIGGDAVEVTPLVGADGDVHVFEPTPLDARRIRGADLVLVNGLHFEGWLPRLVAAAEYRGPVVVATDGITPRAGHGGVDPHAWQDPTLGIRYAENIRRALSSAGAAIGERAGAYAAELAAAASEAHRRFDTMPPAQRRAITSHDAFGYLGAAYGIEFLAAEGWSTDAEPSAADVARLIAQIRSTGIRAVFVENISDPRLIERIAREAGVTVGGVLYSDALSPPGTAADSYLKLLRHNAATIAAGLTSRPSSPA